jgi:hypothetical protein
VTTRATPRPRHKVSRTQLVMLRPFFRWSAGRDAYVLRGIGAKHGPVIAPPEPKRDITGIRRSA